MQSVSAGEIVDQIKQMAVEDRLQIQSEIGQMLASAFLQSDVEQIGMRCAKPMKMVKTGASLPRLNCAGTSACDDGPHRLFSRSARPRCDLECWS